MNGKSKPWLEMKPIKEIKKAHNEKPEKWTKKPKNWAKRQNLDEKLKTRTENPKKPEQENQNLGA